MCVCAHTCVCNAGGLWDSHTSQRQHPPQTQEGSPVCKGVSAPLDLLPLCKTPCDRALQARGKSRLEQGSTPQLPPFPAAHPLRGPLSPTPPLPRLPPTSPSGTDLPAARSCGAEPYRELPRRILSLSPCENWRETQTERDVNFSSRSKPGSPAPVRCGRVGAPCAGGGPQGS